MTETHSAATAEYPLVSVVIPATRDDDWLRSAVASVLDDGYPNLEVIVVWDAGGSPCPTFPQANVRTVVTGGIGTPGANNAGIAEASGEFIARIDSDDVSLPGRFGTQVAALIANPNAQLATTGARVIDADGKVIGPYPTAAQHDLPSSLLRSNSLVHSTFMFRAGAPRYDPRCVRMQDYELALRIAQISEIIAVERVYLEYRIHPQQSGRIVTAFWEYIPVVLAARRALARSLGPVQFALQFWRDFRWFAAQYVNHLGLRDRYGSLRRGTGTAAGSTEHRIRVLQSVSAEHSGSNPYVAQFVSAARRDSDVDYFSARRMLFGKYDIFHIQWPELLLRSGGPARTWLKRLLVFAGMVMLRARGTRIVQTRHNLTPHEPGSWVEGAMASRLNTSTDLYISLNSMSHQLPARMHALVPHGHYRDWFGSLETTKRPNVVDFLCFGQIRRYKGIEGLLDAFRDTPGESTLRIAGARIDQELGLRIEEESAANPRVSCRLERLDDADLKAEIEAAHLVVLPYDTFYNSGVALLALSLDRPILVPSNEITEALRLEVGREWVHTYSGKISASDLVANLEIAVHRGISHRPNLSARDWSLLATDITSAYAKALMIRNG